MECQDENFPGVKFISTEVTINGQTETECLLPGLTSLEKTIFD